MQSLRHLLIIHLLILLSACAITPYDTQSLSSIQWQINPTNTQSGKIVQKRLSSIASSSQGEVYSVKISNENIRQRTIGVDEQGQPSSYLQEALVLLRVSVKGKAILHEPIIVAREVSKEDTSTQVAQQQKEMIHELANDTLLRLNDIANQEVEALIHKQSVYQELSKQPDSDTPTQ